MNKRWAGFRCRASKALCSAPGGELFSSSSPRAALARGSTASVAARPLPASLSGMSRCTRRVT
jgi:hypothetical protein